MPEAGSPSGDWARGRVEIDLGALESNFRHLAARVAPARILPVLKADAYGHGAVEVAKSLAPLGPAAFAVARVEEGSELRCAGVAERVLVFSPPRPAWLEALAHDGLTPVVSSLEQIDLLEGFAAATGWRPRVQLKVDTGMHRLGVPLAEAPEAMARLRRSRYLVWEGLLSHLADAELAQSEATPRQEAAFAALVAGLDEEERERLELHLANSAGALSRPRSRWDLVRPGLALYGGEVAGVDALRPVMSLRAPLVDVRRVGTGDAVGYGGRWRAASPSRIGVVGAGYADGYPWRAGGRAAALVGGRRAAVVGAVSMDLLAVELPHAVGRVGDEVVLMGRQGSEVIRVEELARRSGTIPYELLCHFKLRLPRVWTRGESHAEPAVASAGALT